MTLILIGINIIMFILQSLGFFSGMAFTPATFTSHPWTIVTSMFMHGSLQHLMLNMLGLFMFGSVVEHEIGKKKMFILYFFAGFSGSAVYLLFGLSPFISALGASGAIFGLMGGAAILKPKLIIWTHFGPLPMIIAALGWGIAEFVQAFGVDTIAQSAHIGGLIGGVIIALIMFTKINEKLLLALIMVPLFIALLAATNLPKEISDYSIAPAGFELNSTVHEIDFKENVYTRGQDYFISRTEPYADKFNLAKESRYLEYIVTQFYRELLNLDCGTLDYTIDTKDKNAVILGSYCGHNFTAVSKICPKNTRVTTVLISGEKTDVDVVSCT